LYERHVFLTFLSVLRDTPALAPRIVAGFVWCGERAALLQFSEGMDYRSRQAVPLARCSMSSALVRVVEIKLPWMGWPKLPSFFCKAVLIFHRVSARLSLRGPSQNLLGCFLRGHERRYRNRQLRRNEPYLHARRIQRRFMIPSQAIVIFRRAGHVLGPESW